MQKLMKYGVAVAVAAFSVSAYARARGDQDDCTLNTLRGTYVFAATGYNVVSGVPQPKAIVEVIDFNGNGTLTVPAATRSVNGVVARSLPGGTGSYTVEPGCAGTISFDPAGPTYDTFFSQKAQQLWMIQTTAGTVFEGTATRVSHAGSEKGDEH
jgi:hypothetical protein